MKATLRNALAAALLLAAGNSWALGLGQIEVKSRRHQPLLAEIPIISTTPGELAALQARLASPDTFRRVGLPAPAGIAADLKFSLASDARGRPIIRVTTVRPVEQAALNFLIEVDWGAGRLVREYSALVDAPNTAGDAQPAVVELPAAAPDDRVIRRVEHERAAAEPLPSTAAAAATVAAVDAGSDARSASVAGTASAAAAQYGPVKVGETLSEIAVRTGLRQQFGMDQSMLALLRANPGAFLGDDVNRVRTGAILRVPAHEDVARIDPDEASAVVRAQMRHWRQGRRAVAQPETAAAATPVTRRAPAVADAAPAPQAVKPQRALRPGAASMAAPPTTAVERGGAASADARLKIVPAASGSKSSASTTGMAAGGEGTMLQQQLRQRDEEIAAKSAEIGELKQRLAALEKLKDDQQTLLTLKNTELAAVQQRLADAPSARPATAPAVAAATPAVSGSASASTATSPPPAPEKAPATSPYVWGGLGLALLGALAVLLAGRRRPRTQAPRRRLFDTGELAAGMPAARAPSATSGDIADADPAPDVGAEAARDIDDATATGASEHADAVAAAELPQAAAEAAAVAARSSDMPAWHSGWVAVPATAVASAGVADAVGIDASRGVVTDVTDADGSAPALPASVRAVDETPPVGVVPGSTGMPDVPAARPEPAIPDVATSASIGGLPDLPAAPLAQASIAQRFKLVRAFLDMGDLHSAREMLIDLANDEDEAASSEAATMLSRLVG